MTIRTAYVPGKRATTSTERVYQGIKTTQCHKWAPVTKHFSGDWQQKRRWEYMSNAFMCVEDVAKELSVSKSYAYKVDQKLNNQFNLHGLSDHRR